METQVMWSHTALMVLGKEKIVEEDDAANVVVR